jgi:hypothetical protein
MPGNDIDWLMREWSAIDKAWLDDMQHRLDKVAAEAAEVDKLLMKAQVGVMLDEVRQLEGGGLPNCPAADTAALISEAERITAAAAMEADEQA